MLAAGVGRRLGDQTDLPPKSLLSFGGKTLLQRHIEVLRDRAVEHLTLVVGHRETELRDEVARIGANDFVAFQHNPDYKLGSLISLWTARDSIGDGSDVLIMDADVLYDPVVIDRLLDAEESDCLLLDRAFEPGAEPVKVVIHDDKVVEFGKVVETTSVDFMGEWLGFLKLSAATGRRLLTIAEELLASGPADTPMEDAVRALVRREPGIFGWRDVAGSPWIEIDFIEDIERAEQEILPRIKAAPSRRIANGDDTAEWPEPRTAVGRGR
jgi:choline kinase